VPAGSTLAAVVRSFLLARQRLRESTLLAHTGTQRLGRVLDPCDFMTIGTGSDDKGCQTSVESHPTAAVAVRAGRVTEGRM